MGTGGAPRGVRVNVGSTGHAALDHRVFDKEARSLAAAGFEVQVFGRHDRAERRDGVQLIPFPASTNRFDRFVVAPWRMLRALLRDRPSIVHLHDAELLQICPPLKALARCRIIYDAHEDFANLMLSRDWIPGPLRRVVWGAVLGGERAALLAVDAVVTPTAGLSERFAGHRTTTVYNLPTPAFIDELEPHIAPASSRPVDVVHLGVLSQERLEFLVAVARELVERRPGTTLRVVGIPPEQARSIHGRLPSANVETIGRRPYGDVGRLLSECRVGLNIHPFLRPHIRVALPVKVFEYMAAGCGVVTSWLPELERVLRPATREAMSLVRGAGPSAYAAALARWLDDPPQLDAAAERLRRDCREHYSWESQAPRLVELYEALTA